MSTFSEIQKNECREIKPLEKNEVCPSCIPDPNAPIVDWIVQDEPYFDPRNCEYVCVVKPGKAFQIMNEDLKELYGFSTLREFAQISPEGGDSVIRTGIRHLLRHFSKLEMDEVVCAFGGCAVSWKEMDENRTLIQEYTETLIGHDRALNLAMDGIGLGAGLTGLALGAGTLGSAVGTGLALIGNGIESMLAAGEVKDSIEVQEFKQQVKGMFKTETYEELQRLQEIYGNINPDALEWSTFIPEDGIFVDDSSIVKYKVTIPAFNFDRIPESPVVDDQDDKDPENPNSLPTEATIDDKELTFIIKDTTIKTAMAIFDVK
jgi:hypothetical protein